MAFHPSTLWSSVLPSPSTTCKCYSLGLTLSVVYSTALCSYFFLSNKSFALCRYLNVDANDRSQCAHSVCLPTILGRILLWGTLTIWGKVNFGPSRNVLPIYIKRQVWELKLSVDTSYWPCVRWFLELLEPTCYHKEIYTRQYQNMEETLYPYS